MKKSELRFLVREVISQCVSEINYDTTKGGKPVFAVGAPGSEKRNRAIADPDREEMLKFLQSQFGSESGWEDEAEVAMYWFANFNHGGQWSNLYSVLSTSPFSPGPIARGPEKDSMEEMMYNALEAEYGTPQNHQHGDEEDQLQEGKPQVLKYLDNNFFLLTQQQAKEFSADGKLPRPGYEKKADLTKLRGYMGDFDHHLEPIDINDTTTGWILPTRTGDKHVWALRLHTPMMDEMTTTGAVQGYMSPRAFKKTKNLKEVEWHDEESYKRAQGDSMQDDPPEEHFINGQSNIVASNRVNKLLSALSKGIFSDNSWEAINKIFSKLSEAGIEVNVIGTKYGGQSEQSPVPTFKEWQISIPFTNNKGKAVALVGQITAHGAGTVQDPLSRYDITAYVTPVSQKVQEDNKVSGDNSTGQVELTPTGQVDDWSRPIYTDQQGRVYVDINLGKGPPAIHTTTPQGEPEVPIRNFKLTEGSSEQPIFKDRQGGQDVYWMDNRDSGGRIFLKPEAVARMVKRGHRLIDINDPSGLPEASQPEPYDAETDTFQPSPRERTDAVRATDPKDAQAKFNAEISALKGTHPNISFGYIGNYWSDARYQPQDDMSWYVFNGRSKFGGYDTKDLPKMWDDWQKKKEKFLQTKPLSEIKIIPLQSLIPPQG